MPQKMTIDITNLYGDLKIIADKHNITPDELVKKFFKLGMVAAWVEDNQTADIIIRDENGERILTIFDTSEKE